MRIWYVCFGYFQRIYWDMFIIVYDACTYSLICYFAACMEPYDVSTTSWTLWLNVWLEWMRNDQSNLFSYNYIYPFLPSYN